MRIDLHTHSNRSDGTDPVPVLMTHAQQAGLDVIALTDHDTADGWVEARQAAEELGIGFVPGLEITMATRGSRRMAGIRLRCPDAVIQNFPSFSR